jgi:hypothetical protein
MYLSSDKCAIKGVAPDTATGIYPGTLLMTIEDVSLKNQGKIIDEIICSEEGTYRFSATARPVDNTTMTLVNSPILEKIITAEELPPVADFAVKITNPIKDNYYFQNESIDFIGVITSRSLLTTSEYSCVWFVNDKTKIDGSGQVNSCELSNISLSTFPIGDVTISVYAQREGADGKLVYASDKLDITILKPVNPNTLYLATPSSVFVGDNFNVKIYGTNESQVNGPKQPSNFVFSGNLCAVKSVPATCGLETVSSSTIYYCNYTASCSAGNYDQTGVHNLLPVNISLTGNSESTNFLVGYNLLFDSGNCKVTGTNYGLLESCVSLMNGQAYNENYWESSNYGLLKVYTNVSSEDTTTDYGVLTVYVE